MKRRQFLVLLGSAVPWPLSARAQQPQKVPTIGYLSTRSPDGEVTMLAAFRQGLQKAGYVADRDVTIEYRWSNGQYDRLPALAEELVRRNVTVIVTGGGEMSALAAKAAGPNIPIVF